MDQTGTAHERHDPSYLLHHLWGRPTAGATIAKHEQATGIIRHILVVPDAFLQLFPMSRQSVRKRLDWAHSHITLSLVSVRRTDMPQDLGAVQCKPVEGSIRERIDVVSQLQWVSMLNANVEHRLFESRSTECHIVSRSEGSEN